MSHWSDAGFGTDPEGDARRRAELEPARLDERDLRDLPALLGSAPPAIVEGEVEGEVLTSEPDAHALARTEYPWGVAWTCACRQWEAVATGPSSSAFAERDYARHRRTVGAA